MSGEDQLSGLLDSSLDDLADLPSFEPFVDGAHRCKINFEEKTINKKPAVELKMELLETVEQTDPEEKPTEVGSKTSVLFMLKKDDGTNNDISIGMLKKVLQDLKASGFDGNSPRDIMEAAENAEVLIVTKKKERKDSNGNKTGEYSETITKISGI